MASFRKLLLISAFVASTVAGPVAQRGQCARYCTDESDFTLKPGSTYTYDYETTTITTVQGTSQDKTQLQLTAQVDIEVLSKCELSLRLRGVTLKLSDPESPDYLVILRGARDFARTIERSTLKFSFQNGQVEHVCPSENVPAWVTNIQKGVLSAFQTYTVKPDWTTRTMETDVLGKCTAEYHSLGRSWKGAHTIRKLKDLSSCSDRENVETYLQGTPYSQDFQTKSLPVVTGSQECEQVISEKFLQTSTCNEKLVFRPFSNRGNGVVTTVSQKLIFATTSERRFTGNDYRPTTELLLYSHAKQEVSSAKVEEETEQSLKKLCEASKDDISISVPRKFSTFVYKLKKLSFRSLKAFYQKTETICPGNSRARKFFMDAIPLVSTADSARFMYEMITKKSISDAESNFWLTSLSFITETSPEIISTFTPLLDGRFDQAILGISALIRNYCQGKDCSNVPEVQAAVNKLAENLGENCFSPEDKMVILSLKAIGNIGYMFGKENILEACYKNPQIRNEARLAAIEAFRRVPCEVNREELMKTYGNYNEDTEIRIAAYLAVMRCPSLATIQFIKDVMLKETINHVGSFIWTHLNALSKTKHPERQEIREIISNLYLMNKFASDARKFSSAREATFFLESIDSGIHLDSHLIFTTDSYLPRTGMFNVTVDIFGKSCNLFQLDGRMEGLEHVAESFFGPDGYFPQKNVARLLREKRSLDTNKLDAIDSQFKEHFRNPQQPYGSLDVKVFGTSLWYNQYRHNEDGSPDINLLEIVTKLAEENEKEYSRSFMFLDTTFTIPMTSGMPLKIALNGTASIALKIGGKFDVKSFEHVDVLGHIEPSGAIEISGLLTVDAGQVARSGMRIISTMHSSSVVDGKVQVRRGEVVKVQVNMPRDRIEVFNLKSKLFLVHGMEEREKTTDKKEGTHLQSCTGRSISKVLGVKFCSELELPPYRANAPLQPLNGPARFNLYIEKTDPSLKSYNFDAQWKTEMKDGAFVKHGILSLNTPESEVDRDLKMEFYLNQADHTASLKIKTPVKKLGVNAKLVNTDSQKKLDFGVAIDDKDYFSLQSELGITAEKNADLYRTSMEVRIPDRRLVAVSGSAELRHNQKYTAQLQIEDLTAKPILAKGNLEVGKKERYDVELSLSSFPLDGTVKGYTQFGDKVSSRLTADYRILEGKMNKLNIIGKLRNLSANALSKYTGLLNIQASVLPEWNTEIQFETMKTTGHIENTISIALGDGARSRVHKIKLQEILRYEGSLTNNKVDASLSLVYPEKSIDYGLSVKHENTENSLKNELQLQYNTNKQIVTDVQLKMSTGNLISASGDVKLRYPGREAELQAELSQANNKEYRGTASCQWQAGRRVGVVVHYKDKCEGSRWKYEVDGSLSLPESGAMNFATIAGYHRGQFAASAEVVKGVDKYRTKVDYTAGNGLNHRMVGQLIIKNSIYGLDAAINNIKEKISGNIELKMPNRHRATAKMEGRMGSSLKFASFEAFLDADRNPNKRFLFSGELRSQNEGYDATVNMDILRRIVKGTVSTNFQGILFSSQWKTNNKLELEWSPTEKVSGSLSSNVVLDRSRQQVGSHFEVTTPYSGFENVTFSMTHLFSNQQWESEIATLLPWGNDVTMSSSGKYSFSRSASSVATTAKVLTSFRRFEELSFTVSHDHNSRELTNKAELMWGLDKRISYLVNGVRQSSVLRGNVKLNTPFTYIQDISGEMSHSYTGDNYRTRGEFQWAPSKKLSFNSEGNHELSGRRRICIVNFEGTSPFQGFERTGTKITYSNDGVTINTDVEMKWSNRKKITTSFSLSRRNQLDNKNLEGKFIFTSPFRNYENTQVSTSLEINQNAYKVNVDAQLPHRATTSFNSQGNMISWNDLEVNAVVIAHIPKYMDIQKVSIDIVHKLQNLKLRSTLDTSYGDERLTLLAIGLMEQGYNSRNVEFSATINTPFRGLEELKADFAHNRRGYEYFSKLQMNKNKLSGSLTHKLNIRDALNFETTLEMTSTSRFPSAKISVVQTSNGRQLEHTSYVLWDKNNKIHLNAQYLDKTFLKEFLVKFTSPFRNYRDLELKASMECQDWEHKGVLSFVWDRRHKMTFGADIKNYRWESLNAQLEFTSPFRGYDFYSTIVKYDLTSRQKEAEISFLWDATNRKSVVAKGSYLNSNRVTNLAVSLATPFKEYEKVGLTVNYGNIEPERNIYVSYERGWRRILLKGKSIYRSDSAEVSIEFNSPYDILKEMSALAKYDITNAGLKGEVATDWNKAHKYRATAQYELRDASMEGSIEVLTNFENYEKSSLKTSGSYTGNKITSQTSLEWGKNKVSYNGEFSKSRDMGEAKINVQSSFKKYKDISLSSNYKIRSGIYEAEMKATLNQRDEYQGSFKGKYGGSHLAEVQMTLNSPISPIKNVQLILTIDSNSELYELMSTLKWEDKKSGVHLRLNKKLGQFYEAKMKIDTPFEEFKEFSFDSSLRNDRNQFMDGRLIIATPFDALRNFDAYLEYKNDDAGNYIALKLNTPIENLKIEGKLSNSQFRPFLASIMVEALKIESSTGRYHESFRKFPGMSFKKVSSSINLDIIRWNNAKAKLSVDFPQYSHVLDVTFQQDGEKLNFVTNAKSPALTSGEAIASVKANYKDLEQISSEISLEMLGQVNYLNGQYKYNSRNMEADIRIESPLLRERAAQFKAKFSRQRGDKILNGEMSLVIPSSTHKVVAKYENKGRQMLANIKIDSNLLSYSTLETQAKYINSNGRDIEATFTVSTPTSNHQIVGSLKNYEGEKFAQVKIECPFSKYLNPFTITGTMKHEGYSAVDVSLSVSSPGKEIRIAGNMKNEGWKNVEAFLTLNTPFEVLKMVRLDGKFSNDRFQNIDMSFQVETSSPRFPTLGMTSKLIRTPGSEEMSLMLHLPVRNYKSVQLLGTVHYNPDYSSADSRVTFTLPQNKFVVYGQYGLSKSRISGRGEFEVNNVKWSTTGRLERSSEKKDIAITISTPDSQTYTVGGGYGSSGNRRELAVTYSSPTNERYSWNSTMSYEGIGNFAVDFQAESPYYGYRNLQGSMQHQTSSNSISSNVEYSKDGKRGFLKVYHRIQRDGLKGSVQFGCPHTNVRDVKLSYNRVKKHTNIEDSIELDFNRAKQFKMEVILFGGRSSHFVLDVPVLPLTVTADSKKLENGREINFKSNYYTRVVSFRTAHQCEEKQILHDAAFSWDERAEKRISYDFKLADTEVGKELWARLDTPLRSFMVKGNFTNTSRSRTGGVDFYWDASRSLEKHMAVGFVSADISRDRQETHKFEISMEHPKLSRSLVQSNVITYLTEGGFHLKSSLYYSRDRNHNLDFEVKAADQSRNRRESQYVGMFALKHPVSRLDIQAAVDVMDTKLESSAHLRLNSLDRHQAHNVREVKAKIMKLRQEIELLMRSNRDLTSIAGQVTGRNGEYDISLEKKSNEATDMAAQIKFSRRNRALDVSILNAERDTGLQLSASFPTESASLTISHMNKGNQMTDASLFLGLEKSKILRSKVNWRPKLWEDLRINTGETLRSFIRFSKVQHSTWASSFAEEWSFRVSSISRAMGDVLSPFFADIKSGMNEMKNDIKSTGEAFSKMYSRNEFLMKDIVAEIETIKRIAREAANGFMLGIEVLYNITIEHLENIYYTTYYALEDFGDYLQKSHSELIIKVTRMMRNAQAALKKAAVAVAIKINRAMENMYARMQQWTDRMVLKFDKWLRSYAPCIIDCYYYTKNVADKIRHAINGFTSSFLSNPYVKALRNYGISVVNTFKAFRDFEYTESAQAFLNRVYDAKLMESVFNHPTVDYMSGIAHSVLRKSVEVYHNLGMDVAVSNAAESAFNYVKTRAMDAGQEYLAEFYQSKAGAKYDFSPERGHLSLEFSLPAPRSSLMEVFDIKSYPEYKKMINVNAMAAEYYEDFCVWDFYYKFMKYFTPGYWLPAFSAHALISGNQHFITFDKLSYDFAGKCSYLLARDFVDGNFTVIVNYGTQDHMRKSLTVLVDGKKVDIGNDYKITLDDTKAELPIQIGKTVMIREGSNVRVENERKGFSIVCNFVHNYCSVSLSGFYFGRTAGLFGTFNYEPSLDMMSPSRYVMGDVESFTKSWEVGQAVCTTSDNFATLPANDYKVQTKCKNLFEKSTSEYRACFKQVNPAAYLKMCISDLSAVHENDHDSAICESAAAYFVECKTEGVPLKMPKHCVRCEKQDGSYMTEGDAIQFPRDGTVTAADVVFLVEEKECNKDKVRYLSKMAQGIEENYRQKGYQDVRYRVVGFGGDQVHADPHVHTMDGHEFGPIRSLESALNSLSFGDGPVNILEAVRFAAALTYRPGTTKSFVLMKCSTCKSEEVKAEYGEMLRTLLDGDITLHLLMEQKYEMKVPNKNSKARRVIGVDKRFAYTLKDVKDSPLFGDGDLLAQLRIPKDVCIPLAFEVNGSSFDSHFLTETKKNTNKKFMDVLSKLVVKSSLAGTTDWGMCCECIATEDGVGKSACQRCVSAEMASMISADTFGIYSEAPNARLTRSQGRRHSERRSGQ